MNNIINNSIKKQVEWTALHIPSLLVVPIKHLRYSIDFYKLYRDFYKHYAPIFVGGNRSLYAINANIYSVMDYVKTLICITFRAIALNGVRVICIYSKQSIFGIFVWEVLEGT